MHDDTATCFTQAPPQSPDRVLPLCPMLSAQKLACVLKVTLSPLFLKYSMAHPSLQKSLLSWVLLRKGLQSAKVTLTFSLHTVWMYSTDHSFPQIRLSKPDHYSFYNHFYTMLTSVSKNTVITLYHVLF